MVEFQNPGMQIDLGAIAKGFALDCAAKKLKENGINSCLVNAGGQIYALGNKSGQPWKVGIRGKNKSEIIGLLELKDQSASTSGNYEQFFFKNGRRYCHIIDPRTGYPVEHRVTSITVISERGLDADALSTTLFVLNQEEGEKLLKKFPKTSAKFYQ